VLGVRGCIGKIPSLISARDSARIEYINGEQPSPYELAFGVELNPHSKMKVTKQMSFQLGDFSIIIPCNYYIIDINQVNIFTRGSATIKN